MQSRDHSTRAAALQPVERARVSNCKQDYLELLTHTFQECDKSRESELDDELKIVVECEYVKPNIDLLRVKKIDDDFPNHLKNPYAENITGSGYQTLIGGSGSVAEDAGNGGMASTREQPASGVESATYPPDSPYFPFGSRVPINEAVPVNVNTCAGPKDQDSIGPGSQRRRRRSRCSTTLGFYMSRSILRNHRHSRCSFAPYSLVYVCVCTRMRLCIGARVQSCRPPPPNAIWCRVLRSPDRIQRARRASSISLSLSGLHRWWLATRGGVAARGAHNYITSNRLGHARCSRDSFHANSWPPGISESQRRADDDDRGSSSPS
ncbi:unnamed protein product [Trichogramma brassicae]|uniref:Uncharacterized protein n=1 Tax=Trichogramma brassicae TaxID=86971 RepID=A0A6H5J170_9HYME|nr:unnamed protein product [Trichogramma brassicae]